ncbi:unnamed protein product [Pylaiella littoralis]
MWQLMMMVVAVLVVLRTSPKYVFWAKTLGVYTKKLFTAPAAGV